MSISVRKKVLLLHPENMYNLTKVLPFIVFAILISIIFINKEHLRSILPLVNTTLPTNNYVSAKGTQLYLNGQPFQFTGINAYNIGTDPGINAGCGGPESNLDTLFARLRPNSVVRMWAFQGSITTNVRTKQIDWTGLDRVVDAAQKDNIKLDLVLGNQSGTCDDGHWKDLSWYQGGYKQSYNDLENGLTPLPYLDYVKLIVSRYKDSTAIAFWEPINEPQASDCQNGKGAACYATQTCNEPAAKTALRSFMDTVGGTIKSIDHNHLVESGVIGSGQCGAQFDDYQYLHESPDVDVASYHDYGSDNQPMPGDQYNGLQKRLDQMKQINKPLIVGEVGMQAMNGSNACMSLDSRASLMKAKMDAQFKAGIAGFMPWAITDGTSPICNYDIGDNDPTLSLLYSYPVHIDAN